MEISWIDSCEILPLIPLTHSDADKIRSNNDVSLSVGTTATEVTGPEWPSNMERQAPVTQLKRRIVSSELPEIRVEPSGENSRALTELRYE